MFLSAFVPLIIILTISSDNLLPGTDGGNWIALSKEMFGDSIKASKVHYPPVSLFILLAFNIFLSDLASLTCLAFLSLSTLLVSVFLFSRSLTGIYWAVIVSILYISVGFNLEILSWGGYPQLLAQGFLVFHLMYFSRFINGSGIKYLLLSVFFATLCTGTHIGVSLILCVSTLTLTCLIIIEKPKHVSKLIKRQLQWGFLTLVTSAPFVPVFWNSLNGIETRNWNLQNFSHTDIETLLQSVFRQWDHGQINILIIGSIFVFILIIVLVDNRIKENYKYKSLIISSVILFVITLEVRVLSVLFIGICIAIICNSITISNNLGRLKVTHLLARCMYPLVISTITIIVVIQIYHSINYAKTLSNYYRVLTYDSLQAIEYINSSNTNDATIISTGNRNYMPYSWWIEGLAEARVFSATDVRNFSFKEEKAQVAVANHFMRDATSQEKLSIIEENNIQFIFIDTNATSNIIPFDKNILQVVYENDSIQIWSVIE